jgi:hypothetical protein
MKILEFVVLLLSLLPLLYMKPGNALYWYLGVCCPLAFISFLNFLPNFLKIQ